MSCRYVFLLMFVEDFQLPSFLINFLRLIIRNYTVKIESNSKFHTLIIVNNICLYYLPCSEVSFNSVNNILFIG